MDRHSYYDMYVYVYIRLPLPFSSYAPLGGGNIEKMDVDNTFLDRSRGDKRRGDKRKDAECMVVGDNGQSRLPTKKKRNPLLSFLSFYFSSSFFSDISFEVVVLGMD
jgi:hypothetical protein